MQVRTAQAEWKGNLQAGTGHVALSKGGFEGEYSFESRFEQGDGTNPEELLGAAHAACFSMALAHGLTSAGYEPKRIATQAKVTVEKLEGAFAISRIELNTEADVPGVDEKTFQEQAETAKVNCPVSKALAATDITLNARLVGH